MLKPECWGKRENDGKKESAVYSIEFLCINHFCCFKRILIDSHGHPLKTCFIYSLLITKNNPIHSKEKRKKGKSKHCFFFRFFLKLNLYLFSNALRGCVIVLVSLTHLCNYSAYRNHLKFCLLPPCIIL